MAQVGFRVHSRPQGLNGHDTRKVRGGFIGTKMHEVNGEDRRPVNYEQAMSAERQTRMNRRSPSWA